MKYLCFLFTLTFTAVSFKAQSVVIDIEKSGFGQPQGYYLKDINNFLNQFEGTYACINGTKTIKITLVKKIKQ